MQEPNGPTLMLGSVITFVQTFAVLSSYDIPYPRVFKEPADSASKYAELELLSFVLPTDCMTGNGFLRRYCVKVVKPVYIMLGFVVVFLFGRLPRAAAELHRGGPVRVFTEVLPSRGRVRSIFGAAEALSGHRLSTRLGWFWPVRWVNAKNAMLKAHQALFVVFTKAALTLFVFRSHPEGRFTLAAYPDVDSGSDEVLVAIPIACIAVAIFTVGFLAFVVYIVATAPRRAARDASFSTSYRFIWEKFDPTAWWFVLVQMVHALGLNIAPVVFLNGSLQATFALLLTSAYVFVLGHERPWRFGLLFAIDLTMKLGVLCFLVLILNMPMDPPFTDGESAVLLLLCTVGPVVLALAKVAQHWWNHSGVRSTRDCADFAERLSDIVQIAGARSFFDLRAYAMSLHDRDRIYLDRALNIVQFTMLGLQSRRPRHWRCEPGVPFEVAAPGRLEGELQSLGLDPGSRKLLRLLRNELLESDWVGEGTPRDPVSGLPRGAQPETRHRICQVTSAAVLGLADRVKGIDVRVRHIFETLDSDGRGTLSLGEFVDGMFSVLCGSGAPLSREQLVEIFRYIDADQTGYLSVEELSQGIGEQPEPIYSAGRGPPQDSARREDPSGTAGHEAAAPPPLGSGADGGLSEPSGPWWI